VRDGSKFAQRRLAYFSPLPPERSGIADYSAELLPYIAERVQVTLFAAHPEQVADELASAFEVRPLSDYGPSFTRYDVPLYHMGNNMCHEGLYRVLLRYPGVTVLHDHGLHHFMVARTIPQGDFVGYARTLGYALGAEGMDLAYRIRHDQTEYPYSVFPLNEQVLDHSLGVIVHSQHVKRRIQEARPNLPVAVVSAPICIDPGPLCPRRELGCSEDTLLFVSAGQVRAQKQVALALEAFARLRADFPQARYAVVGDELEQEFDFRAWLLQHGLRDAVILVGHLADIRNFVSWIAAADVLVNLRYPTVGETSATALRGLATGRPVIVSDHGWYAELPNDSCVKVAPNDSEALYQAMRRLAENPDLRRGIGARAAAYARREHSLAMAAQRYLDFVGEIVEGTTARLTWSQPLHDERLLSREKDV
jgi:glycosyltransferase involved in cell wall biosynthesis